MRRTRLYPLNPGVTEVVSEEMLTVGRNLDRNGQSLPTKAFRIQHREKEEVEIVPITNIAHVKLDDQIGRASCRERVSSPV